jgi:hypothetical protein
VKRTLSFLEKVFRSIYKKIKNDTIIFSIIKKIEYGTAEEPNYQKNRLQEFITERIQERQANYAG